MAVNTTIQSTKSRFNEAIATGWNRQSPDALRAQLQAIHADLLRLEREFEWQLAECGLHKESARNLVHYLALRRHDIRQLQEELAALGPCHQVFVRHQALTRRRCPEEQPSHARTPRRGSRSGERACPNRSAGFRFPNAE
jgi:hypothetical protein